MKLNKRTIIIVAVSLVLAVVLFFIGKKLIKKAKDRANDREKARNQAQLIIALENNGAAPAELSTSQVKDIAKKVHEGVNYFLGTDEAKIVNAIKSIPTAADYVAVSMYYTKEYGGGMWSDIKDDIEEPTDSIWNDGTDAWAWGEITAHLNKISVPENLR